MNVVGVRRKLVAVVVLALSGSGVLAATPSAAGAAVAAGCAGKAYVPNNIDGTVSVITTATGEVSASPITVGKNPTGVAITPDGKRAYVANPGDNTVSVITTATGAVSTPITVGNRPYAVAITPDGKQVYVTSDGDATVSVITTATGAVSAPIAVGDNPHSMAISPDGKRAVRRQLGREHGVGDHHRDGCGDAHHRRQQSEWGPRSLRTASAPT